LSRAIFVAGDHEFDLGMWVRGLKRVVAAAVTGGSYIVLATGKITALLATRIF